MPPWAHSSLVQPQCSVLNSFLGCLFSADGKSHWILHTNPALSTKLLALPQGRVPRFGCGSLGAVTVWSGCSASCPSLCPSPSVSSVRAPSLLLSLLPCCLSPAVSCSLSRVSTRSSPAGASSSDSSAGICGQRDKLQAQPWHGTAQGSDPALHLQTHGALDTPRVRRGI